MRLLPIRRRRRILLPLLLLLVGAGICRFFQGREPHYRGRPVSGWVAELRMNQLGQRNDTLNTLLDIGPDSLPPLVAELKRRDNLVSRTYGATWRKLPAKFRAYLPEPLKPAERR